MVEVETPKAIERLGETIYAAVLRNERPSRVEMSYEDYDEYERAMRRLVSWDSQLYKPPTTVFGYPIKIVDGLEEPKLV